MKLKNLFTCTVTGLLLCTSCIKDEAPNAEADILSCILPAEMLTGTAVSYTHLDVYKRQIHLFAANVLYNGSYIGKSDHHVHRTVPELSLIHI